DGDFLVRHDLRQDDEAQRLPARGVGGLLRARLGWPGYWGDAVVDRRDRALGQRDQPHGLDLHRVPGGRGPDDLPRQGARAHVEGAGVGADGAVPDVERLVVDEQPDYLAIGDVDDGLPHVGETVARLRVRQRAVLVQRVQVRARQ